MTPLRINSFEEQADFYKFLAKDGNYWSPMEVWLDLSDLAKKDVWQHSDGVTPAFVSWDKDQPVSDDYQNCAYLTGTHLFSSYSSEQWDELYEIDYAERQLMYYDVAYYTF